MRRALLAAALLFAAPAAAEDQPRFALDAYDMIGGCPDERAFRDEVERRAHGRTKAPLKVAIHVVQQPRSIEGTVDLVDPQGARSSRRVSSNQCAEIVSAFALVVALAIDDAAENAPAPPPAPPAPLPETTPPVAPSTIDWSRVPGHETDIWFRAGVEGALQTGVVPNAVASVPIFVELAREAWHPGFHLEPRLRLGWTFAASSRGQVAAGEATFHWTAGALDLCPLRLAFVTLGPHSISDLRVCGRVELGVLSGDGEGSASATKSEHRLWAATAVPFTFRISPAKQRLFFEIEAGPRFPIVRDTFRVGPAESFIFKPPAVGAVVGIGGGVSFR